MAERRKRSPQKSVENSSTPVQATEAALLQQNVELSERLAALELALDTLDWRWLSQQAQQEFSRPGLRDITDLARVMYLKNPLIKRGVEVQRLYVWGQDVNIRAKDTDINAVLTAFDDDTANQTEFTSHAARMQKEIELQTDGNLFLVFFVNQVTGRVRMRSIVFDEIEDVIRDPEDAKTPWYYKRLWKEQQFDTTTGVTKTQQRTAYYPDWRYNPAVKPSTIGAWPVMWNAPVFHIKVGGFSNWAFGLSEIYAAIDWARAYKEFLEDWASIVRAYRRFAFQLTTDGGKQGIAAAKAKLATTMGSSGTSSMETNPPAVAGSTFVANPNTRMEPIRTAGATVSADDGRRMMLMVAAAAGLPETFYGDVSTGAHATAKTMDRPTELKMVDRQTFWADILKAIYAYVLFWSVKATNGPLRAFGQIAHEVEGDLILEHVEWNEGVDSGIDIDFAPILQQDVEAAVNAIVNAGTLSGRQPAGTISLPDLTRMLLVALGQDDVDEMVERLFPNGEEPEEQRPETGDQGTAQRPAVEAMMVDAVRELRDRLLRLRERASSDNHLLSAERYGVTE